MRKRNARLCALVALALAASLTLAACGDDDDDEGGGGGATGTSEAAEGGPAKLNLTVSESGKQITLDISGDMRPGITQITLQNTGKKAHTAQLIGVRGNRTAAEVKRAYAAASAGKAVPDWLLASGGVGSTEPGATTTVTQDLDAGTYYVFDDEDEKNIEAGGFAKLEIDGERKTGGSLPSGATVRAVDYSFEPSGLKAGRNTVVFENADKEPHHIVALPINRGKTIEDVKKVIASDERPQGPPPFDEEAGVNTSVIDGGVTLATDLALKKGKYALLCFIADRKGGPPHVAKGMVTEATVE